MPGSDRPGPPIGPARPPWLRPPPPLPRLPPSTGPPASAVANRPSIKASSAPARTTAGSARPPSRRLRAWINRVLPAPVSPVSAVMPGPGRTVTSSITPRLRTRSSTSMCATPVPLPVGETELGPEDGVEVAPAEGDQPSRLLAFATVDDRPRVELGHGDPVDHQHRGRGARAPRAAIARPGRGRGAGRRACGGRPGSRRSHGAGARAPGPRAERL